MRRTSQRSAVFIWAELIVAVSAVVTVRHRLLRTQPKPES